MVDKELLEQRFCSSAYHYDKAAKPQNYLAEQLVSLLGRLSLKREGSALEIGCGTGLFSEKLIAFLEERGIEYQHTFNDLTPVVERLLREKIGVTHTFLAGDAEVLPWGTDLSLITSSASIQWWHNPLSFPSKAYEALVEGGVVAFSTFLPDNLHELSSVTHQSLKYPNRRDLEVAMKQAHFREITMEPVLYTTNFPNIADLLQHLKHTGTNLTTHTPRGLWTPSRLQHLEEKYRLTAELAPVDPLPLTYSAILITALK